MRSRGADLSGEALLAVSARDDVPIGEYYTWSVGPSHRNDRSVSAVNIRMDIGLSGVMVALYRPSRARMRSA